MGFFDIEVIFAIDIDMGVPRGPDMGQITRLHGTAFLRQLLHHGCHIDRIPDDDRIGPFGDTPHTRGAVGRQGLGLPSQFVVSSNNLSPTHDERRILRGHHSERRRRWNT